MRLSATIHADDQSHTLKLRGRLAWTLSELLKAGDQGITSLHNPGPRLSHYVMTLRRKGVVIETIRTEHGGQFPGHHGIYRLVSCVTVETIGGAL